MTAWLVATALRAGVPQRFAKLAAWAAVISATCLILGGVYLLIHSNGEKAGAAKIAAKVEKQHTKTVAEARTDEQHAQVVTTRIADRAVRADAATDAYVRSTIEDLRNALATETAAPVGAAPPPAPVASMSASLNGLVNRANRAAEAAEPAP